MTGQQDIASVDPGQGPRSSPAPAEGWPGAAATEAPVVVVAQADANRATAATPAAKARAGRMRWIMEVS